ncbi:MAG: hypothetical protein ACI4OS_07210 [Akkermansia sp.]
MTEEWILFPLVKGAVATAARAARWVLWGSVAGTALELLLAWSGLPLPSVFCGLLAEVFQSLLLLLLVLLMMWCHRTLTARRGLGLTRAALWLALPFAGADVVNGLFGLVTGRVLLAGEALLQPVVLAVVLLTLLLNLPLVSAAPLRLRAALVGGGLLLAAVWVCNAPGLMLLVLLPLKVGMALLLHRLLGLLAGVAPRVIALPPCGDS